MKRERRRERTGTRRLLNTHTSTQWPAHPPLLHEQGEGHARGTLRTRDRRPRDRSHALSLFKSLSYQTTDTGKRDVEFLALARDTMSRSPVASWSGGERTEIRQRATGSVAWSGPERMPACQQLRRLRSAQIARSAQSRKRTINNQPANPNCMNQKNRGLGPTNPRFPKVCAHTCARSTAAASTE